MLKIHESDMWFYLSKEKTFPIEKSDTYRKVNTRGVSTVEFITLGPKQNIMFVEAKKTAPDKENDKDISKFVASISKKFVHSLEMCYALLAQALPDDEPCFPDCLREAFKQQPRIKLILIVKNLRDDHRAPLGELLRKQLRAEMRIWNMNVFVFNEDSAVAHNFVYKKENSS